MEAIFMSAGIMTAIILCSVGLIKLPFEKFKKKYPNGYKATFTGLSFALTFGACLINQVFILAQPLFDINFFVMFFTTCAGVFGLYNAYEGLGAKELVKKLTSAIGAWFKSATPDSKVNKLVKKYGLDKIESSLNTLKTQQVEVVVEQTTTEQTDNSTINQ